MIFVWGEKVKRRRKGHVADLCQTCREVRDHGLIEVREVPHVYYVPIGRGKIARYEIECGACGFSTVVEPSRYSAMLDEEIALDRLVALTNPGVLAELEERKQREERALSGQLHPDERVEVMIEALYPVVLAVEERANSGAIDARTGLLGLGTLLLSGALFGYALTPEDTDVGMTLMWASGAVACSGVVAMVHAAITSLARYIRRTQGEGIQAALRPFNPSPLELNAIAENLRAAGTSLGKKLDASWLTDLFHSVRAVSF